MKFSLSRALLKAGRASVVLLVTAVGLLTVAAQPAAAAPQTFWLVNESKRCIGISASGAAGHWNCTYNADQRWRWGSSKDGHTQLVNGNGFCLGIAGASYTPGAAVVAYNCDGDRNQYWRWQSIGWRFANIQNLQTAQQISVLNNRRDNGAPLVQRRPEGVYDQRWTPCYAHPVDSGCVNEWN